MKIADNINMVERYIAQHTLNTSAIQGKYDGYFYTQVTPIRYQ